MMEIAEARVLADQLKRTCVSQTILKAQVLASPHKFCWLNKEPAAFASGLNGREIVDVKASAHFVRLVLDDQTELIGAEDLEIRSFADSAKAGAKHQLLIALSGGGVLRFAIRMYGFLFHGRNEQLRQNSYVRAAFDAIDPRSDDFTYAVFLEQTKLASLKGSVKEALATDQHIPGLGNGTLQDILFEAGVSPRRKTALLTEEERLKLYRAVKNRIWTMTAQGGRDGWVDLYGNQGGYERQMKTERDVCPNCREPLRKEAYLGGKVIYCPHCQT